MSEETIQLETFGDYKPLSSLALPVSSSVAKKVCKTKKLDYFTTNTKGGKTQYFVKPEEYQHALIEYLQEQQKKKRATAKRNGQKRRFVNGLVKQGKSKADALAAWEAKGSSSPKA